MVHPSVVCSLTRFLLMPKIYNFLYENHRGNPTLTLLNVLNVLNVLNAQGPIVGRLGLVYKNHVFWLSPGKYNYS